MIKNLVFQIRALIIIVVIIIIVKIIIIIIIIIITWNLEVYVFVEGGKPKNSEEQPQQRSNPTINSTYMRRRVRESNPGQRGRGERLYTRHLMPLNKAAKQPLLLPRTPKTDKRALDKRINVVLCCQWAIFTCSLNTQSAVISVVTLTETDAR